MKFFKKYWPIIIFLTLVTFIFLNTIINCIKENNAVYDFKITKIEVTPTRKLVFYNNEQKILLWNFKVSENQNVKVGDLVYKEKCSRVLLLKRKNGVGEYKTYSEVKFSGMVPFELICK